MSSDKDVLLQMGFDPARVECSQSRSTRRHGPYADLAYRNLFDTQGQ